MAHTGLEWIHIWKKEFSNVSKRIFSFLLVVSLVLLFVSCNPDIEDNPDTPETKYEYYDDGSTIHIVTEFNSEGKESKRTYFRADGSIYRETHIKLSEGKTVDIYFDSDGSKLIREYEDDELKLDSSYRSDGSLSFVKNYLNGLEIKLTSYNADGSISSWKETEYTADGSVLKEKTFNADGSLMSECDSEGNLVGDREYTFFVDNMKTVERYDQNMVKKTSVSYFKVGDEYLLRYKSEYDDLGYETRSYSFIGGELEVWIENEYSDGEEEKHITKSTKYDPDNLILEVSIFDTEGIVKKTHFNSDGTILSVLEKNELGEFFSKFYTVYNSNGTKDVFEYDENERNNIKTSHYDSDGILISWEEMDYDEDNLKIKHTYFNIDGSIDYYFDYYQNGGYKVTYISGKGYVHRIIEYNSNSKPISIINYSSTGAETSKEEYWYDSQGRTVSKRTHVNRHLQRWYGWEYDENGKIVKEIEYNEDGSIHSITLKY